MAERYVQAPANSIENYETYTIEFKGKQRKGVVILKGTCCFLSFNIYIHMKIFLGTKQECNSLQYNVSSESQSSTNTKSASKSIPDL